MSKPPYVAPTYKLEAFNCPHCNVYSHQKWESAYHKGLERWTSDGKKIDQELIKELEISTCSHCSRFALWLNKSMISPDNSIAPLPSDDMPDEVKKDFDEARSVLKYSPRASAALLRLCLQRLMPYIGGQGKNINDDIKLLVEKGLDEHIQKSLDIVRIIGNESVHPGQIDLKDDLETAELLFHLINLIVDNRITQKKRIDNLYAKLPQDKILGVFTRDKKSETMMLINSTCLRVVFVEV